MRTLLIVFIAPGGDRKSCVAQIAGPVGIETFVAEAAVEAFDDSVRHRLAPLDGVEPGPLPVAPGTEPARGEIESVVYTNRSRQGLVNDLKSQPRASRLVDL